MLSPTDWTIELEYDSEKISQNLGKSIRNDDLFTDANWNSIQGVEGVQFQLTLHPKHPIQLKKCRISCSYNYQKEKSIFANGYQSWSLSKEYFPEEQIPALRRMARPLFKYYGDDWIPGIKRGKGQFHSWTYSYVREAADQVLFLASLNESSCFTRIHHDTVMGKLVIEMDLENLKLAHSYPALEFFLFRGNLKDATIRWRNMLDLKEQINPPQFGWNSWYRFYRDISPNKLTEEIQSCKDSTLPIHWFQIDDGFQKETGDWLKMKPGFENKLPGLARSIRKAGMVPGIWLAPFVCSAKSEIFKTHPDWILKNKAGKKIKIGYNPMWGGWYYGLNSYHPGVQEYLTGIFHILGQKMGYELFKLDFLFAAAVAPPLGKTRGQVMHESMDFLRRIAGPKVKLLACGIPLAAAFGKVDICRIGPDIHLKWDHKILRFFRKRERVSTKNALQTILGRWMLNKHFFLNDPDVFILRKKGHHLSDTQQLLILQLNRLLGGVHFTSDKLADYSAAQLAVINKHDNSQEMQVQDIRRLGDHRYEIVLERDGVQEIIVIQVGI